MSEPEKNAPAIGVGEFQLLIDQVYGEKDRARGLEGTFLWFHEEVGELTRAVRRGHDKENLEEEFADVLAWLVSTASIVGVDMEVAIERKYGHKWPKAKK
jgi:NTP pyrophosphatase (non-canonical NTP hydrolase)|tara:strand:- start:36 stop:335 length:300 start_codon:yes stop_codon:yes gene_type:complete